MNDSLDEKRIQDLSLKILSSIRDNYRTGLINRDRVYEALNALAFCSAHVIRGCADPEALEWFIQALSQNMNYDSPGLYSGN